MRVVEPEFAFRLAQDLPSRTAPFGMEAVMAAVADLHLAIEIPDARIERFADVGAPSTVADDAFAGWVILGPKIAEWRGLDLTSRPARVIRNGMIAGEGRGGDALGDPRQALLWLANDRAARENGLKAGDIVITGTRLAPVEIRPGDRVTIEFPDLGELGAAFD
ncbi:MAG: fumarylacetoacetate hydrolase family protein [Dongiaceae bacterium]